MRRHLPFFLLLALLLLIIWDIPFVPKEIYEPHLESLYAADHEEENAVLPDAQTADVNPADNLIVSPLHLASFCPYCEAEPIIKPGDSSDDLPGILEFLKDRGYYKGELTSHYTDEAVAAVKTFQLDNKLTVDGIIGAQTWQAIGSSFATLPIAKAKPETDNLSIFVDLWQRQLTVFADGVPYKTYPIAIGKASTPTPVGQWKITGKLYMGGAFGPRFLSLNVPWGNYGIHGTNRPNSISTAASAGCIRMYNPDILELFSWVSVGTPVTIYNGPYPKASFDKPTLQVGSVGSAVYEVQQALKDMGYITFNPDGVFGSGTQNAIKKLQEDYNLPVTGVVSGKTYDVLGLYVFD